MTLQEIKQKLPLSQVLQHYGLKPDKNLRLYCPFHDDTTPSLPGRDGMNGSKVGKDAFAYTLGYYPGDYQPLNGSLSASLPDQRDQLWSRLQGTLGYGGLYNGNIAWVVTDLPKLGQLANDRRKGMQGMLYGYDQLNRIVQMSIPEADENLQHPMRI